MGLPRVLAPGGHRFGHRSHAGRADRVERLKQGGLPSRNLLELLGASGRALPARQIVIADQERPLAVLGGEVAADRGVVRTTTRMAIAAVQVKGVPEMSVEEALWSVAGVLSGEW